MINKILRTNPSWSTVPLRLALGLIFIAHGSQKLFGWFGGYGLVNTGQFFESQLGFTPGVFWVGLAGCGEFFGGLLVVLGLVTRLGALSIGIVMLVAMLKVHFRGGFFLPNGIEYTFALFGISAALFIYGGGRLSFDDIFSRKLKQG